MLTVIEPAETTELTTLDRLKLSLGITEDTDDEYLDMLIDQQSDYVCAYLNVAMADDGTRTIGRETLTETFSPVAWRPKLILSRFPVFEVTEILVGTNNEPLDPAEYSVNRATGLLYRGSPAGWDWWWSYSTVSVTYSAGWLLPGDEGTNLPAVIEGATMSLISTSRAGRGRDPLAKSETIPGVISTEYWVGPVGTSGSHASGMPPDIASRLSPYRRYIV
jgi:hypothetical protein